MNLGERIKLLMQENNIKNNKELSTLSKVPYSTIRDAVNNVSSMRTDTATSLANFFEVSVDYLLGLTSIKNPKTYLEEQLYFLNLTEQEYEKILNDIIENERLILYQEGNDERYNSVMAKIFSIYMNYIENVSLDFEIVDDDEKTINEVKAKTEIIDKKFINLLKTLDKNNIIQSRKNIYYSEDKIVKIPVVGKISAGLPILASENLEGYEFAPSSKINTDYDYFYLIVKGDSMNRMFQEGDRVLVQKQSTLENGNIGVILINGDDATVKKFKTENGLIVLEPMSTNTEHSVQIYDPNKIRVEIIGKVISYTGNIN